MAYELLKQEMYNNLNGINVKASEYLTADNQVLDLRNLYFERPGAWITRPGYTGFATLASGSFAPESLFSYNFDSFTLAWVPFGLSVMGVAGSSQYIYDSGNTLYQRSPIQAPITSGLGPGSSGVGPTDFQVFNNILYFANGYTFQKYNGASTVLRYSVPTVLRESGSVGTTNLATNVPLTNNGATYNLTLLVSPGGFTTHYGSTFGAGQYNFMLGAVRPTKGNYIQKNFFPTVGFNNNTPNDNYEYGQFIGSTFTANVSTTAYGSFQLLVGPTLPLTSSLFASYGISGAAFLCVYAQYPGQNKPYFINDYVIGLAFAGGTTQYVISHPATQNSALANTLQFDFSPSNIFFSLAPRFIETYNNIMFMAGMTCSPSTVWHTDVDDADTVEPDFSFDVRTEGNGEVITGMKVFHQALVITKQNSVHEITGFSPDDLSLSDLSLEYGNMSNQSLVTFENRMWMMDPKGICEYNGNNFAIVSERVAVYLNRCDKATAKFFHLKKYNQVWCLVRDNTDSKYKNFCYDYLLDAWTIYDNFDITAANLFANSRSEKELHFYGQNQSLIPKFHSFNSSLFTDDSFGVTQLIRTKFHKRLGDSTTEMWRRHYLNNSVEGSTLIVTVNMYQDYGASIVYSTTMGLTSFQSRIDFGVPAKSLSIEDIVKTTTQIRINGYTVESRYLRPV